MVFLLYVISALLTLSGGAAAVYGADTIRTETGSTMAVAGVAVACAGLLVVALAACLSELKKIRELVEAGEIVPVAAPVVVAPELPAVTAASVAAAVVAADRAPADAGVRGAHDEPGPAKPADSPPVDPLTPTLRPTLAPEAEGDKAELATPDPDRSDRAAANAGSEPSAAADAKASAEDMAQDDKDAVERDETGSDTPATAEGAGGEGTKERELVATYASGEHTYFMYSDSAIEAETPQGRFRFSSMDELRVFVETGKGGMPLSPPPPRKPD